MAAFPSAIHIGFGDEATAPLSRHNRGHRQFFESYAHDRRHQNPVRHQAAERLLPLVYDKLRKAVNCLQAHCTWQMSGYIHTNITPCYLGAECDGIVPLRGRWQEPCVQRRKYLAGKPGCSSTPLVPLAVHNLSKSVPMRRSVQCVAQEMVSVPIRDPYNL